MSSTETMKSWPRLVTTLEDLPEPLRARAERLLAPGKHEHAVYLPPLVSPSSPQVEHLVALRERELLILRRGRREMAESSIELAKVTAVEHGKILLYSWLSIAAGGIERTFTFNTVGEELLLPFIRAARANAPNASGGCTGGARPSATALASDERLETLVGRGYKFMNYGRMALESGDRIEALLFEPALAVNAVTLFGRRAALRLATPHLWMLTQRELIVVHDEKEYGLSNRPRYGAVTLWVPRDALRSAAIEARGALLRLSVASLGGKTVGAWFAADNGDLASFAGAIGAKATASSAL